MEQFQYTSIDIMDLEKLSLEDLVKAAGFCRHYAAACKRSYKDFEHRDAEASYFASVGVYIQNEVIIRQNASLLYYLKTKN